MQIYLSVKPEEIRDAAPWRPESAFAAYRIGDGSALLSRNLLSQSCNQACDRGLLVLSDGNASAVSQPDLLADAVMRECSRRHYRGAVLDFELPPREDLRHFAALLSRRCADVQRMLFLPESYADAAKQRIVIINTAVSGGNFENHIRDAVAHYGGAQNTALDIQRLQMAFSLPARSGEGTPLEDGALDTLLRTHHPAVFFSRELCARYFTCTISGEVRFILFDDAMTLRRKLQLGQQLGLTAAFFQWPEIHDLAGTLFR